MGPEPGTSSSPWAAAMRCMVWGDSATVLGSPWRDPWLGPSWLCMAGYRTVFCLLYGTVSFCLPLPVTSCSASLSRSRSAT